MDMVKPNTPLLISILNFLGISLLASAGISAVLVGIVLLLSLAN